MLGRAGSGEVIAGKWGNIRCFIQHSQERRTVSTLAEGTGGRG